MKKLLIAAVALVTGFSLMADEPTLTEQIRTALQGLLEQHLEGVSTNLNFRAWNRLNQINKDFNTKILNNSELDKTVSTYFNQKVKDSIVVLSPASEEDAALLEQGFRYKATVDFSDFGYTFTENEDKTGFVVAESESGALEVYYTARSEDDLPPGGGEEPPPGGEDPPPGAGEPPTTIYQRITLAAGGDAHELLVPYPKNSALAVVVRVPSTFVFGVSEQADGGEWETILASAIVNDVDKTDSTSPYVSLRDDAWNVSGLFSMIPPSDSPDPTVAVSFAIGQDPKQNLAGINFNIIKDGELAASLRMEVTNTSDEAKVFDFRSLDSLAEFATVALADCSVTDLSFSLSDSVTLNMSVDNCAEVIRIKQLAKRYRNRGQDTLENMQNIASNLNEYVSCSVDVNLLGVPVMTVPLELKAVKFGTDYVVVPAFQFDPTAGEEGWVALTDMVTQKAVAYALNIADHAVEPARGALVAGLQVTKYIARLVSERLATEDVVPATMAEVAADQLKKVLKASALNTNFTSWERINALNLYFNEHVINNPEFDKTLVDLFNRKVAATVGPATGEVAVKGYAYSADIDLRDLPYTFTAKDDFTGFVVTPSESGTFEMVIPYKPSEKASGYVKVTVEGSGDTLSLFGPSAYDKSIALILYVPSRFDFTIASAMNGKDYHVDVSGSLESKFTKADEVSDYVNLGTDSWVVTGTLNTSFEANPRYPQDDASTLNFEISQDTANSVGTFQLGYVHNGRNVIDLSSTINTTGEFMDFSAFSTLSSIDDIIGLIAATRDARQISVTFFDRLGLEISTSNGEELYEVSRAAVQARRSNADYETIDAFTKQLNELATMQFILSEAGLDPKPTLPMTFVTVPFGVTFNASPAIIFPDDPENPVPVFALFDDDARAYLMNIIDQAAAPAIDSATTVKQLAVAFRSLVQKYTRNTSIADVEQVVYGEWAATTAVTVPGVVLNSDDSVAGSIQLKVSKPNKKGTVRVSGSVMTIDGKRHSIKSTTVQSPTDGPLVIEGAEVAGLGTLSAKVGETNCYGTIGDSYYFTDAVVGGAWTEENSVANVDFMYGIDLPEGMTDETIELLPTDEPVTLKNGRWAFNKAARVKMSNGSVIVDTTNGRTNLSAMKLTYTPKTGVFKGSFRIYTVKNARIKRYTVKVTGVVVDGFGFGTATLNKEPTGWSVTVD